MEDERRWPNTVFVFRRGLRIGKESGDRKGQLVAAWRWEKITCEGEIGTRLQ